MLSGRNFGEIAAEYLAEAFAAGFIIYGGMPNGTEIGQEMDQLFSFFKKLLYNNRDLLWKERVCTEGASVTLNVSNFGHILFGGEVTVANGDKITLEKALERGLERDLVKGGREKCGYCPATRAALQNSRVRHEVVEAADGDLDLMADPDGGMIVLLERENRRSRYQSRFPTYQRLKHGFVRAEQRHHALLEG